MGKIKCNVIMESNEFTDFINGFIDCGFLPKKHWFYHSYCFYLHDKIAKILKEEESKGSFDETIEGKDIPHDSQSIDIIEWLKNNGYKEECHRILIKSVLKSTISDLLHFLYTGLDASKKGKTTVTYANLRKPLKENLLLLEWINDRPEDFLDKFEDPALNFYAGNVSPKKKKELIEANLDKSEILDNNLDKSEILDNKLTDFLFKIRYDQDSDFGLAPYFDKATHITTNNPKIKTEKENLNFVFSNEEDVNSQWDSLYILLPLLLIYTAEVVFSVLGEQISTEIKPSLDLTDIIFVYSYFGHLPEGLPLQVKCDCCGEERELTNQDAKIMLESGFFSCKCGTLQSIFYIGKT